MGDAVKKYITLNLDLNIFGNICDNMSTQMNETKNTVLEFFKTFYCKNPTYCAFK